MRDLSVSVIESKVLKANAVADAIGADQKAFRNWLDRGQVEASAETETGRFLFSAYDVAMLSLVKPLTEFGIPVRVAADISTRALKNSRGVRMALKHKALANPGKLAALLAGTYLRVFRRNGGWAFDVTAEPLTALDAFIQIDVWRTVSTALRRAQLIKTQPDHLSKE